MGLKDLVSLIAAFAALAGVARAQVSDLPLDGTTVTLPECREANCFDAAELVLEYARGSRDPPEVFTIGGLCSPWRMYGFDGRIVDLQDVAATIRSHPKFAGAARIELQCSWSGVAPAGASGSLASRLGALVGKPTSGEDGFLWMGPDGARKTTHQSFTAYPNVYRARRGEFVLTAAVFALPAGLPELVEKDRDAEGLRYVGVFHDVFSLRSDLALAKFELAARYGDAIGAYNAALIRLERSAAGDRERPRELARRSAELGDAQGAVLFARLP